MKSARELIKQECSARGVSRQAPCCSDRCDGYSNAAECVIERLQALLREVISSEDDARLNICGGWIEDILPRIRAALGEG